MGVGRLVICGAERAGVYMSGHPSKRFEASPLWGRLEAILTNSISNSRKGAECWSEKGCPTWF